MNDRVAKKSRRLLVVAFHYPPDNTSTGVLRTLKFTQYLGDFGWHSEVLTVPENLYHSIDHTALSRIPRHVRVHRVWAADTKKVFGVRGVYPAVLGIPDRYWLWIPSALRQVKRLLQGNSPIDAIFTTYPVPSALVIGLLAKRRYGLPWIADFRDPWVEETMIGLEKFICSHLERKIVENADRVICNTPRMRAWFSARYPHLEPGKLVTIPNGYDADELAAIVPQKCDRFHIFYGGVIDNENRNPRPLLEAVRFALDRGWLEEERLRITFLGAGSYGGGTQFREDLAALQLERVVQVRVERAPYYQALSQASGADVILVLSEALGDSKIAEAERAWSRLQVPVKVYEGLGMKRQILALVSDGAVRDVLQETGSGAAVAPDNVEEIARCLKDYYRRWLDGQKGSAACESVLARYDRRYLTQKLADVLADLIA